MPDELMPLDFWDSERTWSTFEDGTFHSFIGDVEVQKCEWDLDRYDDLIEVSQPDVIIETGTRAGGSALWFREQGLRVFSIDKCPPPGRLPVRGGITYITDDSADPKLVKFIQPLLQPGQRVMVSLDSDHHAPHVVAEIMLWAGLVTPGCYLVIEDGCFEQWDEHRARKGGWKIPEVGGPVAAINQCWDHLSGLGFYRDIELETITSISHSPVGWWRRDD